MRKIIVDTDMGPDCDDAGALAVLHALAKKGEAKILGVTHCTSSIYGALTISAINKCYGREDIPVGKCTREKFLCNEGHTRYSRPVGETYIEKYGRPDYMPAVSLLRKLLAENRDVTIVTIGMFNNVSRLLESMPDEFSPLCGEDLIKQSVSDVVSMAGIFKRGISRLEYNVKCDVAAAKHFIENCPVKMTFLPSETGISVMTGEPLRDKAPDHPVRVAYDIFTHGTFSRPSWDLETVYLAVRGGSDMFRITSNVSVFVDESGATTYEYGGKDSIASLEIPLDKAAEKLNALLA